MSSTSNAQDLLVNVFRPTYKWDSNTGFVPSLVVSNVTEVIASKIKANALVVSDNNVNTYIGADAGVNASNTLSNVGIGFSAMGGALNATSNVAIGTYALEGLSNSDSNVAIGAATDISGVGMRNVLIGTNVTLTGGSNNILIGVDLSRAAVSDSLQIGTLLYGNLSNGYIGINTTVPTRPLDVSGEVVFRNKVGIQKDNPVYTLDVAGSVYATEQIIGGKGTVTAPMYTFIDSSGSGMYVPQVSEGFGTGAFAIAVNRAPAAIFSSNAVNFYQDLDVSGTFSARNIDISAFSVTDGTQSKPAMTFISDLSSGLYLVSSNRFGLATGGLRRMEILSNGDVSAGRLVAQDISLGGTITTSTGCNVIGGVTLSNGNVILTGVATNTNLLVPGWFRNSDPATQIDISGGNISNSLTTRSSNFRASSGAVSAPAYSFVSDPSVGLHLVGTSTLGFDTSGVQRMCISGGFVGIGRAAPVVALDVLGDVSATTYNGPGGTQSAPHYTFSDDRTTGVFFPGANMIGMTAGGTERMRISNGNVGIGTTTPANALDVAGTIRVIGTTGGDLTFSNGNINLAGVPVISSTGVLSNASTTSNSIGGVTLNNGVVSNASSSVNTIGGVFLSSCNVTTGTFTTNSSLGSNNIGGVTLSNTNITYAGAISNTVGTTSNRIGGVTLSNGVVSNASTSSNSIGGVTLSNTNITFAGAISNTVSAMSNQIGGVTLCNGFVVNPAYTNSSQFIASSNGSAGSPGFAFGTEAGLGVYKSDTATIGFATGGLQRMVLSNSVLAIGRTPLADTSLILQTAANAYISTGRVYLGDPANSIAAYGGTIVEGLSNGGGGACDLLLYSRPSGASPTTPLERMRILGSGNVGIGTRAPESILDISFASTPGVVIRKCGLTLSNTAGYGTLKVRAGPGNDIYVEDGNVNPTSLTATNQYTGWIFGTSSNAFGTNSRFGFYRVVAGGETAGFRPFTIDASSGYVGMGTVAPVGQLSVHNSSGVNGASNILALSTGSIKNAANSEIQFRGSDGGTGNVLLAGILGVDSASGAEAYHGDLVFRTTEYAGSTPERMRIKWNGKVGIGMRTPTYLVDVSSGDGYAMRVTNGKALFDVEFQGASQEYAVTTLNGYFGIYKANTTNKAASNIMVSLSPDAAAPCYILSNRLAIGQRTAGVALDVSAGNSEVAARFRVAGITGNNNVIELWAPTSSTTEPNRRIGIATNENTGTDAGNDLVINTYKDNGLYHGTPFILKRATGRVGIGPYQPAHALDVTGIIRGSSNIVAVDISYWSIGSNTGFVDTTLAISYTPKQTGTVNVILTAGADITVGNGSGGDSAQVTLQNGSTVISYWLQTFDGNNMTGRGGNMMFGGRTAFTTISGTTSLGMRLLRGGDDGNTYANAYLSVMELSTT
jgi:hypothetical protein